MRDGTCIRVQTKEKLELVTDWQNESPPHPLNKIMRLDDTVTAYAQYCHMHLPFPWTPRNIEVFVWVSRSPQCTACSQNLFVEWLKYWESPVHPDKANAIINVEFMSWYPTCERQIVPPGHLRKTLSERTWENHAPCLTSNCSSIPNANRLFQLSAY